MSYYGMKGDYYAGDYYAGDPGIFSAIGSIVKKATGLFGRGREVALATVGKMPGGARAGEILAQAKGAIVRHPVLTGAGGAAVAGVAGAVLARGGAGGSFGAPGMRGFHMSKPHTGVPPHMVRNRRMHVTNPRALRRALRRAQGFAKLARRVLHFTSPRAPKGRALFRARRKKRA